MKHRCSPYSEDKKYYYDRGISVCLRWKRSFFDFYNDMGPRPFKGAVLDRINTNKGYSKNNCRWTTQKVNNNNRTDSVYIKYRGMRKSLKGWSEYLGVNYYTLHQRRKSGWSGKKIIATPVGG